MRTIKHNLLQVHAVVRILWPRMVKNKQTTTRFVMLTSGNVHVQVSTNIHIDTPPHLNGNTIFYMDSTTCRHRQWGKVPSIGVQVRKDSRINRVFHLISLPWLSLTRVLTWPGLAVEKHLLVRLKHFLLLLHLFVRDDQMQCWIRSVVGLGS